MIEKKLPTMGHDGTLVSLTLTLTSSIDFDWLENVVPSTVAVVAVVAVVAAVPLLNGHLEEGEDDNANFGSETVVVEEEEEDVLVLVVEKEYSYGPECVALAPVVQV